MAKKNDSTIIPKNVLIARFSALGDIAMTIPVVYSVCRANPSTRFIMLTQEIGASLFINTPQNLEVIGVDIKNKYQGIRGLILLFNELMNKYNFDSFIDLHDVLRTKIFTVLCRMHGIRSLKINKGRSGKRALTRATNKQMFPLISSHARYREVFYRMGFKVDESFISLFGPSGAEPSLYASITPPKQPREQWIAIAPFAKHEGKIYPIELMEKVVAEISTFPHTHIFLFGAGAIEIDTLKNWAQKYPNTTSLAHCRYGFAAELALLSHVDAMISMDSANMHLASLVNTTVLSVWGATHPYCGFMGWHQDEQNAVQLNMLCRPCSVFGNKPCRYNDYRCLSSIPPKMIIKSLLPIITKR